jgi:predicted GIY-YIG superfamily endonuclease
MQYLYRAFSNEGNLLYVGISSQWHNRLHQHEKTSGWIHEADYVKIERFEDRESAAEAEKKAIVLEKPRDNKVFSEDYESASVHWAKIKKWILSGKATDQRHQELVDWIRESGLDVYGNKPRELRPKGMAFLFGQEIEINVYHGYKPCRNCAGVWNSTIIQDAYVEGELQLLEVGERNGLN